jgi:hypothetical protein
VRRYTLPIAAILLTAACSSGTPKPTLTAHDPMGKPTRTHSTAPRASSTPQKTKVTQAHTAKPKPSKSKGCGVERDVIVWYKVPGIADSAQVVGNYNLVSCETTFHELQHTSPTGPGYCTEAAWASDNPGYNADADVPQRPKKVQVAVGPAC